MQPKSDARPVKSYFTIDTTGASNPNARKVIEAMKQRILAADLTAEPYLAGVQCRVYGDREEISYQRDAVALFDGTCNKHFTPVPPQGSTPAWACGAMAVMIGRKSAKSSHRPANNIIADFTKKIVERHAAGEKPWGKAKTNFKRRRGGKNARVRYNQIRTSPGGFVPSASGPSTPQVISTRTLPKVASSGGSGFVSS